MAEDGIIPQALAERPTVAPHLREVWRAFWDLHGDRSSGMTRGALPFVAIDRWADRYEVGPGDEFETFHRLLRLLDAEFLAWKPPDEKAG